jgi:mannose-6-phosphate isomerase-like protein (cupin superfamily)
MTSKAEMIGAALAKAVKAATGITSAQLGAKMFRTNIKDVPKVEGLKRDDGWIDMQVQFLIDKKSAGADHVVGWTVLRPGASHECHKHRNCDEFFIVLKGKGHIITEKGLEPSGEGDVVYSPRNCWHGFNNTSQEDVVLVWGWMGAGSIADSGYEVPEGGHKLFSPLHSGARATASEPGIHNHHREYGFRLSPFHGSAGMTRMQSTEMT